MSEMANETKSLNNGWSLVEETLPEKDVDVVVLLDGNECTARLVCDEDGEPVEWEVMGCCPMPLECVKYWKSRSELPEGYEVEDDDAPCVEVYRMELDEDDLEDYRRKRVCRKLAKVACVGLGVIALCSGAKVIKKILK